MHRPEVRLKPFNSPPPARHPAAARLPIAAAGSPNKRPANPEKAELNLPPLLKVSTVARLLDVSKKRVYFMIDEGKLECVRLGPRLMRVRKASLEAMMRRRPEEEAA